MSIRPYGRKGRYRTREYYFRIMPDGTHDWMGYMDDAARAHDALDWMIENCACCLPVKYVPQPYDHWAWCGGWENYRRLRDAD